MLEAKGINGNVIINGDKLTIQRKGFRSFITQGLKGDKDIYLNQISSIQLKKAGLLTNGYIQFAFLGGHESKGGLFNAVQDENTVMFNSKQQRAFESIKSEVDNYLSTQHHPAQQTGISDLEKLAILRDKGIITEGEFLAKKKQILGI